MGIADCEGGKVCGGLKFLTGNGQFAFYGEGKRAYTKEKKESYGLPDEYTPQESPTKPDHGLFVAYAPVETPEITVAVRIVNGYGSSYATAAGRDILEYYFREK